MAAAARKKPRIPEGYESEADYLDEVRERFSLAEDADKENREAELDDLNFLSGVQWDQEYEKERLDSGRPCLTVNRLPQFVAQVVGDIRMSRPAIKVRPAEDGDKKIAETRQGLIRAIEMQSNATQVYTNTGLSQVACGRGQFRVALEYASNDVFERDIKIRAIPNAQAVVWDPMSVEPTGRDARWCFVIDEVDRKAFEKAWPDASVNEMGAKVETEGWLSRETVRVAEYWVMKETPAILALLENGKTVEVQLDGEAGYVRVKRKGMKVVGSEPLEADIRLDDDGREIIRETTIPSACMYLTTGHAVLDGPYEWPISRLPVFRAMGWEIHVGTKRVRWGLVRFAKDPARLKNYWRSVAAEVLSMASKAQWLLHESEEGDQASFRESHKSGNPILTWNGQVPPQRVDPPAAPNAILQEAQLADQDMKDVTGIHDASLGARSNETSGKAILARQREGDIANIIYSDNLQDCISECGGVINELIDVVYDTARTVRTLGDDETTKSQRINDPNNPDSIDLTAGKYDVVVETGPSYSTKRVEAAESMMAFVQAVPGAAQVAADLIAKAQDWPLAEQIGERLKKTIPPQLLQGEDGQEPAQPPQPDPMQVQAQQMQMQGAQFDLAEKQAKASKAGSDARKAEAEAKETELNLAAKMGQLDAMLANAAQTGMQQGAASVLAQLSPPQQQFQPAPQPAFEQQPMQAFAPMEQAQPPMPPIAQGPETFGQEGSPPPEQPANGQGFPVA